MVMHGRGLIIIDPLYNAGREHVGFLPTRPTCLHQARSAMRCSASRMKGELHATKTRL